MKGSIKKGALIFFGWVLLLPLFSFSIQLETVEEADNDSTYAIDSVKEWSFDTTIKVHELNRAKWKELTKGVSYEGSEKESEHSRDFDIPNLGISFYYFKYILFALIIAAFGWIIYRTVNVRDWSKKVKESDPQSSVEHIENINQVVETDYEKLLIGAVDAGDFRMATRIMYILLLKKLHVNHIIHWKKEKTNAHYLVEIAKERQKDMFKQLTFIYERVWYGNFPLTSEVFEQVKGSFNELNLLVEKGTNE